MLISNTLKTLKKLVVYFTNLFRQDLETEETNRLTRKSNSKKQSVKLDNP